METQMPLKLLTKTLTVLVGATLVAGMLSAAPVAAFDTGGGGGSSGSYGSSSDSSSPVAASAPSLNDARALIRAKKWKSAASALRQIVRTDPRNADANNLLGYALRKSGDYKTANHRLGCLLDVEPGACLRLELAKRNSSAPRGAAHRNIGTGFRSASARGVFSWPIWTGTS